MIKRIVSQPDKVVYYFQPTEAAVEEFAEILLTIRGLNEYIKQVDFYPIYCQNRTSFCVQFNDLGGFMEIQSPVFWPGGTAPRGLCTSFQKAIATTPTPEPQTIPIHISYSGDITLRVSSDDLQNAFIIVFRIEHGKVIS